MKNLKLFAIVSVLAVLVSCNNGLTKQTDKEEGLVAFSLEFDGKTISSNNTRNIGIDSVEDALKDFVFSVNLINKEDNSKNISDENKTIGELSTYLRYLPLAKGSWTIKINGSLPGKDSHITGSTDFTVGGREAFFVLELKISGSAKGSIEYNTRLGKVEQGQKAILYPLEKYLSGTIEDGDGIVYEYPDEENPPANAYKLYPNLTPDTIVLEDVTPGNYFLQITYEDQVMCSDVAYVYPGLTSSGKKSTSKMSILLDLGCGNVANSGLEDRVLNYIEGYAYLPGFAYHDYDADIHLSGVDLIRPGYIFTGWYDNPQAYALGQSPAIPIEQKFIPQKESPDSEIYTNLGQRTLYAGWKKANVSQELLNEPIYFGYYDAATLKIKKDNLYNYDNSTSAVVKLYSRDCKYICSGNNIYSVNGNDFYYASYTQTGQSEISSSKIDALSISGFTGSVKPSALYKEGNNIYLLSIVSASSINKLYITKITEGTPPTINGYAASDDLANITTTTFENLKSIEAFAVLDNSVIVVYKTNSDEVKIAKFSIQNTSISGTIPNSLQRIGEDINLSDIYNPYPNAILYVRDMYVENSSVYLLVEENSYLDGESQWETFVSTGAVVELDTGLSLKGIYGRVAEDSYFDCDLSNTDAGAGEILSSYTVSHSYDMSAFAGPKKIYAIFDRKMIIFDEGSFPYRTPDDRYNLKKWLGRVTVFDLDKKCIDYVQISELKMLNATTVVTIVSGFEYVVD